jgi:hypothetical protein
MLAKGCLVSYLPAILAFMLRRCGRSSGVERNLAKVEVVSSNLIARSISLQGFAA